MSKTKRFLLGLAFAGALTVQAPTNACCGDGEVAATGAKAAGENITEAIESAAVTIIKWLTQLDLDIAAGFAKVVAEIDKQTAAMRTFEQGNAAVQSQLYMEKTRAEAIIKNELSPRVCFETAGGASATVASGEVREALNGLNRDSAARTLFTPNTTAAVGKIYDNHVAKYCSQQDADLGSCSVASDPLLQNADVRADATLNKASYASSDQIAAAQAFVNNVINPIPTQNIPKYWEKTPQGKNYVAGQYIEQARASVAANSLNAAVASRIPIQGLGTAAMLNKADVSEQELMESMVRGRFESLSWYKMIASFSLENMIREANKMMALNLWMDLKSHQQTERIESVLATQLAITVERQSGEMQQLARRSAARAR